MRGITASVKEGLFVCSMHFPHFGNLVLVLAHIMHGRTLNLAGGELNLQHGAFPCLHMHIPIEVGLS